MRAFDADDRISNPEKKFSLEQSINQSAQSSKIRSFASSSISLVLHNKSNVRLGAVQQVYNVKCYIVIRGTKSGEATPRSEHESFDAELGTD